MLLGKVANPMSGKIEKNMEAAKATIDTLEMLKAKTKGNLSKEEEELVNGAVQQLQVNFVSESEKPDAEQKEDHHCDDQECKCDDHKCGDKDHKCDK